MAGLHDALRGSSARITDLPASRLRRVRYGDATVAIDSDDDVAIVLNLTEAHRAWVSSEGRSIAARPQVGAVTIVPPGRPLMLSLQGTATVLLLQLSRAEIGNGADECDVNLKHNALEPRVAFLDPVLAYWLYTAGSGLVLQDEALRMIAGRLVETHRERAGPAPLLHGGLSPARLRRVQERVDAGLAGRVPLADLASEAGLSLFHFVREFGRTTGMPPHRYVLQRRLGRAIALLAKADLPVTMVAAATGFSDAGHLARHLRRTTGMAPEAFRSRILVQQ